MQVKTLIYVTYSFEKKEIGYYWLENTFVNSQ